MADLSVLEVASYMDTLEGDIEARYPKASTRPDGRIRKDELRAMTGLRWKGSDKFVQFPNTAIYSPVLYLPQAIGWKIARSLDLTIIQGLTLSRLFVSISAITLGWFALRACPSAQPLLFVLLLLPTVLNLNASDSQDGLMPGCTALAASFVLRAVYARRGLRSTELIIASIALACVVAARAPYFPLALILLLPTWNRVDRTRADWVVPSAFLAGILLICAAWQWVVHPLGVTILPGADPATQALFLKSHPVGGLLRILLGFAKQLPALSVKGLALLGVNDVFPPRVIYPILFLGALLILAFWRQTLSARVRFVLILLPVSSTLLIAVAGYVFWTPAGIWNVGGLQSRYFIPLLPLLLAAILPRWSGRTGFLSARVLQSGLILYLAGVLYTPFVAAHVFYNQGLFSLLPFLLHGTVL